MDTTLEAEIQVAAAPEVVWTLIADPSRMVEWSPQVKSVRLKGDGTIGLGTLFTNRNADGELEWSTHAEITRYAPDREIAFRIEENWATWSIALESTDAGTRVVQRRETPDGVSPLSKQFSESVYGGVEEYSELMLAGMKETLAAIKAAAEA